MSNQARPFRMGHHITREGQFSHSSRDGVPKERAKTLSPTTQLSAVSDHSVVRDPDAPCIVSALGQRALKCRRQSGARVSDIEEFWRFTFETRDVSLPCDRATTC